MRALPARAASYTTRTVPDGARAADGDRRAGGWDRIITTIRAPSAWWSGSSIYPGPTACRRTIASSPVAGGTGRSGSRRRFGGNRAGERARHRHGRHPALPDRWPGTASESRQSAQRRMDSFRANFCGIPVRRAGQLSGDLITSFHLPAGQKPLLADLVRQYPSITVLDVDALMVRSARSWTE